MIYTSVKFDDIHLGAFQVIAETCFHPWAWNLNPVCNTPLDYALYFCKVSSDLLQ